MELTDRIERYLTCKLLPYWFTRVAAPEGGFTTYFDRNGLPTGQTDKTLIQQTRSIFMLSHVIRSGYDPGGAARGILAKGVEWFLANFLDREHGGWFWIVDKDGRPLIDHKIVYGHSFAIYALSEYTLATGDPRGRELAEGTFELLQTYAADTRFGGYREMFLGDWQPRPGGALGGDRKSFDVHMHLMEAYTTLAELTGKEIHRRKLAEVIGVLWGHMFDPRNSTGIAQFGLDFTPLPAIVFKTVWGSDRDPGKPRPLDNTSYGHNLEFLWLFLHALEVLGEPVEPYRERLARLAVHTLRYGIDPEHGGLYIEGPHEGPARDLQKEFWQQAETLVGMLDAYLLLGDPAYWRAFRSTFDFVWNHMINHEVGEWFALLDRDGRVLWDYLGHAWKNNYHTVRSMVQVIRRLRIVEERGLER